jgi:hypothetical protein
MPPMHAQFRNALWNLLICCLLGSMVACLLVPCTSRERSCDMVHYNGLDSLTAGLKQTTSFCMIAHICHDLYQGVFGWFCGLASELGLAHSGAVHPANSPMAWPWCQCHSQATAPRPTGAHFSPSKKVVLEHFVMVWNGKGSQFMHLLQNALHLTLQARCQHCLGCHFELEQVGFTANYRPRQCLLTSRNTFFSIFGAGLLEPHGSESCTWHSHDLIPTVCLYCRNALYGQQTVDVEAEQGSWSTA